MRHAFDLHRRRLLAAAGSAGLIAACGLPASLGLSARVNAQARMPTKGVEHTIHIAPISLELAPGKIVHTTGYNGSVPGPALRLEEGRPVRINVVNDSGYPNLIHW